MSEDFDLNLPEEGPKPSIIKKFGGLIATILAPITWLLSSLPRKVRIVLIILMATALIISGLFLTRPQAKKRPIPETVVTVEVVEAQRADYPVVVSTNGTIQADIRGNLVSQIRGEIVRVSDSFKNGAAFSAGDVLIQVDERDYIAEVSQALSAVSQAKATLKQEQALANQAKTDWNRLGNAGEPPSLVAREPQLAAARAQTDSANARYQTAKLNLERTKIKAPYNGRVIQRNAVLGQYVSVGSDLAEIFATEGVEVRLPVSQEEYLQLGLDSLIGEQQHQYKVEIHSQLGQRTYTWDAFVTRTDSTFDLATRQIDVIAEVVDPFSKDRSQPPLKIGQFVNARILGRKMKDVITLPNKALREGSYVFTSQDNKLVRTPITLSWQDDQNAVIDTGINDGDIVVTTSLNSTLAGARVAYQNSVDTANIDDTQQTTDKKRAGQPVPKQMTTETSGTVTVDPVEEIVIPTTNETPHSRSANTPSE